MKSELHIFAPRFLLLLTKNFAPIVKCAKRSAFRLLVLMKMNIIDKKIDFFYCNLCNFMIQLSMWLEFLYVPNNIS